MRRRFRAIWIVIISASFFSSSLSNSSVNAATPIYSVAFTNSNSTVIQPEVIWGVNSKMEFTHVNLTACDGKIASDCVSSFEYKKGEATWKKATLTSHLPLRVNHQGHSGTFVSDPGKVIPENPTMNIPASSPGTVWSMPGAEHSTGNQYLLNFHIFGNLTKCSNTATNNGQEIICDEKSVTDYSGGSVTASILPVGNLRSGDSSNTPKNLPNLPEIYEGEYCLSFPDSKWFCLNRSSFPESLKFRVTINLKRTKAVLNGFNWIDAKSAESAIEIENTGQSAKLVLEGSPLTMYNATGTLPQGEPGIRKMFDVENAVWSELYGKPMSADFDSYRNKFQQNPGNFSVGGGGSDSASWVRWNGFSDFIDQKSSQEFTKWEFKTVTASGDSFGWLTRCTKDSGIAGLSSSNATVMFPGPPTWSASDQSLNMRIAAPHMNSSGAVISGFYRLVMPVQVAACLWGTTPASAKVEISIIENGDVRDISTSVMNVSKEQVYFDLKNFHYSAPQIKIRVLADAKPASVVKAEITLKCKKGKLVKIIKGLNPKCPTGFKRS